MKKVYLFLLTGLMLFATTATAQVSTIADFFGKYRFTATMELFDSSYAGQLSDDCDVVIEEDANYIAKIVGFAGSQNQQNINAISTEKEMLKVTNPNTPQLWNGLYLANENGDYPYGIYDSTAGEWTVESYGPVYYTYDPDTRLIEVPDFTVVTCDHANSAATVVAKFTNVKLTLVELYNIEIADISGEWNFKAGSGTWDTMEKSVIPTEFAISLVKSGDNNKNYNATMTINGYNPFTFAATFDGNSLVLPYDNLYLDEENGIRFAPMYGSATSGNIEFKSTSEDKFSLYSGFSFASDTIGKASDEITDSLYVNAKYHQWYTAGVLSRPSEAPAFSWEGTFNVKVSDASQDVIIADAASGVEWPAEFQMVVQYWEVIDAYYVTNLFGLDLYNLNSGGLPLVPGEDGKSATITLNGGNYGVALLKSNGDGTYLALTNQNGVNTAPVTLTLNEDGTVTIEPVFVQNYDFSTYSFTTPVVFYQNMTAEKEGAEEPAAFDWSGTYALTSTVETDDAATYPSSFYVTVTYNETYDMYLLTELMGIDITSINYGGLLLSPSEDGKSATLNTGYIQWIEAGSIALKLRDVNGTTSPIELTLNDDGTVSASGFSVVAGAYGDESMNLTYALYSDVVLEKGGTVVEPLAPLSVVSVTPDAPVTSLSEIVIEFSDEISGEFDIMGMNQIYLGNRGNGCEFSIDGTKLTITPFYAITAAGEYKLVIPSGLITRVADGSDVTMNGEYVFTVEEAVEPEPEIVYYRIKSKSQNKYLNVESYNANNASGPKGAVGLADYAESADQIFVIEEAENGKVYLKSESGYYIVCRQWNVDACDNEKSPLGMEYISETEFYLLNGSQYFKVGEVDGQFGSYYPYCDAPFGLVETWVLESAVPTGIEDIVAEGETVEGIFDLAGRKLDEITVPGIYIINGKKVLVK